MATEPSLQITPANVQKAYIAYFNRPADAAGLLFWTNASSNLTMIDVMNNFAGSAEFKSVYPDSNNLYALVNSIYLNLFGRPAEASGATFWVTALQKPPGTNGAATIGDVAYNVARGAQGSDLDALNAKVTYATAFTTALTNDPTAAAAYSANIPAVRGVIGGIDTAAEATSAVAGIGSLLSNLSNPIGVGQLFNITAGKASGADVMRLTGDQDVRTDFTDPANQVKGLDLNGNGRVENNGLENIITGRAANFEIVDAYARNPLNETDRTSNFLGDLHHDGTGYDGDGVNTDGNVVLGGLGVDRIFGGVGNDFLASGGIAQARVAEALAAWIAVGGTAADFAAPFDYLQGGRNADFFFVELSALDATDGNRVRVDGGTTADDSSAGTVQTPQDADWLLFEASDDDEPVTITMRDDSLFDIGEANVDDTGTVMSRSGQSVGLLSDIENFDASGNLYGFLDGMSVEMGGRRTDSREVQNGTKNNGLGSSAQLLVEGSNVANIIIGGYDNDDLRGNDGNDLLFGGNLDNLINPNLLAINTDGRDVLTGGLGNDDIVFEADGGSIEGDLVLGAIGAGSDTLWLTNRALGTKTAADVTTDNILRFDLNSQDIDTANGYGGADVGTKDATPNDNQDQTNYKAAASLPAGIARSTVQDMDNVIATGLGAVDYDPDGTNTPNTNPASEPPHLAQVNIAGYQGNLTLRGTDAANILYANTGNDVLEGRAGNDKLSGGDGNDDFVFAMQNSQAVGVAGDGVDVVHRQVDANGDNIWDGYVASTRLGTFGQDFGQVSSPITANSKLTLTLVDTTAPDSLAGFPVNGVAFKLGGVAYTAALTSGVQSTYAAFVAGLNAALDANATLAPLNAVLNADKTITITDPAGKAFEAVGYTWVGNIAPSAGTLTWNQVVGAPSSTLTQDKLIYQAYEDRADGEKVNDNSTTGSSISLGTDAYAEDLVIDFAAADYDVNGDGQITAADADTAGTRLAEDQAYTLRFTNLTTQDTLTIGVNGVLYKLTAGIDLDGRAIANEMLVGQGGAAADQNTIQDNFLTRMAGFITSFMDDDTAAGKVLATYAAATDTMTISQVDYDAEETVFMRAPTVQMDNASAGEIATVVIANTSQHDVQLLDFDGRNALLNASNVLFLGDTGTSRSILATMPTAGTGATAFAGTEAIVIDGGVDNLAATVQTTNASIASNTATNANLAFNFTVHGDDFLLSAAGNDSIQAGTGDDRVHGSLGTDTFDGGKSYYAVQVLGEPTARVYVLNQWEATNPTLVTALGGLTISSINRIADSENDGTGFAEGVGRAEVYSDTLQFQQNDFTPGVSRFTVVLDNYAMNGTTVELRNGGAGRVLVDANGDGTTEAANITTFTNFENVRTISGTGNAVADSGQGQDTLDVVSMSNVVGGAAGIEYNLSNDTIGLSTPGQVRYSANAHVNVFRPVEADFEALVIRVDGVESVNTGTGNDLLLIDETEAAKHNSFSAGLGVDRIVYNDVFVGDVAGVAVPTTTIKVNALGVDTDTVTMTGGRVGLTRAVDTLASVEIIGLDGDAAEGSREDDVVDTSMLATGAVTNYADTGLVTAYGAAFGSVRDSNGTPPANSNGALQVIIEGIEEMENVVAGAGNDRVLVADADVMNNNTRSDESNATPAQNILFMTYADFDDLNALATTRKTFAAQVTDGTITTVINQGQFSFSLSNPATAVDVDRVDYAAELGRIVVPVGQATATTPQYVVVDGNSNNVWNDVESRVDILRSVEEIVASLGDSVLDFTGSNVARQITFQYAVPAGPLAENKVLESTIRIADGSGNVVPGLNAFVERYTYNKTTAAVADATWERVEGGDQAETVIYQGSEDLVGQGGVDHRFSSDTLTLRGGSNEVRYSPLETSIKAQITVVTEDLTTTAASEGKITATITFEDGVGAALAGGGTHTITSNTSDNTTAAGNLKLEASQDAEDKLEFLGANSKVYIIGASPGVVSVNIGTLNTMVLTGFEFLIDGASNDVYDMKVLASVAGLTLTDGAADHDTIKVYNDAINYNAAGANTIDLDNLSATVGGFGMDFDALDITGVTGVQLDALTTVNGGTNAAPVVDVDGSDEVVFGRLGGVTNVNDFEGVVMTEGTITGNGTSYVLNTTANTLVVGAKTLTFNGNMNVLSFNGISLENSFQPASTLAATTGVTVSTIGNEAVTLFGGKGADSLAGSGGADFLRGGQGNDILDGSFVAEVKEAHKVTFSGNAAVAGNTFTVGGVTLTTGVSSPGGVTLPATATPDQVADAFVRAFADATFFTPAIKTTLGLVSAVKGTSGLVTFTFGGTTNVNNAILGATDTSATVDTLTNIVEYAARAESSDTYVFEATAALNGTDVLNNFDASDILNVSAFLGASVKTNAANATAGLDLSGAANYGVLFNKASLAATDIALTAAGGKIALEDNSKAVVLVTGDVDGNADTTNTPYDMYFVQDTDTRVGFQTFAVTKVATINSATELSASQLDGSVVVPAVNTVSASAASVNEGAPVTFNVATIGMAAGTLLNYTLSGAGITVADTGVALTGTVAVGAGGAASLVVTPTNDLSAGEGAETLTMTINGVSGSVVINDTSTGVGVNTVNLGAVDVVATVGADVFVYEYAMVAGRATRAVDGVVSITGFDIANDKLVFEDVGAGTVLTEAQFKLLAGVSIAEDPFSNQTNINFDADGGGIPGGVSLVGIQDAALANIVVETLA